MLNHKMKPIIRSESETLLNSSNNESKKLPTGLLASKSFEVLVQPVEGREGAYYLDLDGNKNSHHSPTVPGVDNSFVPYSGSNESTYKYEPSSMHFLYEKSLQEQYIQEKMKIYMKGNDGISFTNN